MSAPNMFPMPAGLKQIFSCVRPLIFKNPESEWTSVPGTGFLLRMFGQIFLVTAGHTVHRGGFNLDHLQVSYNKQKGSQRIPFSGFRTFHSKDPDDTDHVDIIVGKFDMERVDPDLFCGELPFDISFRPLVTNFFPGMRLHFQGLAPTKSEIDDETQRYDIHLAAGDLIYEHPLPYRATHLARADINADCPDFDGMSGSPVFRADDMGIASTNADFAGMLIRGSRTNQTLRFLDADTISKYLFEYVVGELPRGEFGKVMTRLLVEEAKRRGIPGPSAEECREMEGSSPWYPEQPH